MAEIKEIFIDGEIGSEFSVNDFKEEVRNGEGKEIHLHINSPGGSLMDAFASTDIAGFRDARVSTAVINGLCGSAATIFSCMADSVSMGANSWFFIHNPSRRGQAGMDDDLLKMKEGILDIYMNKIERSENRSKVLSRKQVSKMMDEEALLNAKEAIEIGFVDFIHAEAKIAAKAEDMINKIKNSQMDDKKTNPIAEFLNGLGWSKSNKNTIELKHKDGVFNVTTDNEEIEGKNIDAKDGTYTLDDERTIEVENGIIKTVNAKEVDIQDTLKQGFEAVIKNIDDKLAPITARLDALEKAPAVTNEAPKEEVVELTEKEQIEARLLEIENETKEAEKVKAEADKVKATADKDKAKASKVEVVNKTEVIPGEKKTEGLQEPPVFLNLMAEYRRNGYGYKADQIENREN